MFFSVRKLGNRRGLATIIYSIIPKNSYFDKSVSKKKLAFKNNFRIKSIKKRTDA